MSPAARLARAKRTTLANIRRLRRPGVPWVTSMVECDACGYRHVVVIPADSPHVKVRVERVQCCQCYLQEASTVPEA